MTTVATLDLTADEARRLTERIRLTAHTFADSRTKLIALVEEAKAGNAHAALGYASWTAYLSDVLGDEPLRLARDDRKELVGILAAEGMSTRAIAPIVGASQATVAREVRATESNDSVGETTGLNGKAYSPKADVIRVDANTGEVLDATTPTTPRRNPLPEQVKSAGWELRKAVERLERLAADDRFNPNKEAMAPHLRGHLTNAIEVCQDLLDRISN